MTAVTTFRTEGLGDSTYLLVHDGIGLVVDPQRDIERFLAAIEEGGVELRWVLETHLHNDYVSGAVALARQTGAELLMPASAAPAYRHTPAFHGEEVTDRGVGILPLHTPGHTPEHTSYLVSAPGHAGALFSGGSLLVGSAGRSDLLGQDRAETLARLQYRSVKRLALLPEATDLFPTHGAGSFCTVSAVGGHVSTVGSERRHNPILAYDDEESFLKVHLADLQPFPLYYSRMAPMNLAGPAPMPALHVEEVAAEEVEDGSTLVDIRSAVAFTSGHLAGSLNIPLSPQFATWFGWLVPPDMTTYLVAGPDDDVTGALTQLARIGVDSVAGVVPAPEAGTRSAIGSIHEIPDGAQVLDVRSPGERKEHAPAGTIHRYLPDLTDGPPPEIDPDAPVWVMCTSGYRAAIAASLLGRKGIEAVAVIDGGTTDLPA